MNFLEFLRNWAGGFGRAKAAYRRGMKKAHRHDHQGAIDEYTLAIQDPDAPSDIQAMAIFNRAIVFAATNQEERAIADLRMLLNLRDAPPDVHTEARRKLARMDRKSTAKNS